MAPTGKRQSDAAEGEQKVPLSQFVHELKAAAPRTESSAAALALGLAALADNRRRWAA